MSSATVDAKEMATTQARVRLRAFLEAQDRLQLPRPASPRFSILLVLYNRAELTLACLRSMQPRLQELAAEVVLVDNASRDETSLLLDRIDGARIVRNVVNRGFPEGVNRAAEVASGKYLLLLNNDTEVLGDSLRAAERFLTDHDDVGAVGGRIVLLDGTLQEAGCTLWREAHVFQYGRGDSPTAPEYQFQRDVDYCSGAFLMTRRDLFARMGGLDDAYSPGYFEDVDYCVRLWRAGWRVVYLPEAAILHFENASSPCRQEVLRLYRRNRELFSRKHADWLAWQCPSSTPPLWARSSHDDRFKVLYLPKRADDAARIVDRLRALHCFVTVYPLSQATDRRARGLPADAEFFPQGNLDTLPEFLAKRRDYYDCILTSEPKVQEWIGRCVNRVPNAVSGVA